MCEGGCGRGCGNECRSGACARAGAGLEADAGLIQSTMSESQHDAAIHLAELLLNMELITEKGRLAKHLARVVLGVPANMQVDDVVEEIPITTNGTTRWVPHNEPLFLIRGSDVLSGDTVRFWAQSAAKAGCSKEIVTLAEAQASLMDVWPNKKLPDLKL